mmetsp:Transcript_38143/g.76445  ORF Transcript_38143/g.76445 Transcript_38143/m.76445 type:complete len:126 (+) Transcript_38143:43-420(+)
MYTCHAIPARKGDGRSSSSIPELTYQQCSLSWTQSPFRADFGVPAASGLQACPLVKLLCHVFHLCTPTAAVEIAQHETGPSLSGDTVVALTPDDVAVLNGRSFSVCRLDAHTDMHIIWQIHRSTE